MVVNIANYATKALPNFQSGSLTHESNVKESKNQSGQLASMFSSDDMVHGAFEYIPESGAAAENTLANTLVAASLPAMLSAVTLSGFKAINVGGFTDVFNSGAWIYRGGAKINQVIDGPWTISIELHRYVNMAAPTSPS